MVLPSDKNTKELQGKYPFAQIINLKLLMNLSSLILSTKIYAINHLKMMESITPIKLFISRLFSMASMSI